MESITSIFEEMNKRKEKYTIHCTEDDFATWLKSKKDCVEKENNMNKIRIKKMRENAKLPEFKNGNWMDTYVSRVGFVAEEKLNEGFDIGDIEWIDENKYVSLHYPKNAIVVLKLGFALELPKGKELHLLPRSGTFRKHGLILTNGTGIGDDTFIGDNDEYMVMMYAVIDGNVCIGDRLIQMKIEDAMPQYEFEEVEYFGNKDRGSFGSTGR